MPFEHSNVINELQARYAKRGLATDFEDDRSAYDQFLPELVKSWDKDLGLDFVSLIAVGTAGSVWRVHDRTLDREHALKLSHPRLSKLPLRGVRAEIAEPRTLAALNHQNVVRVYLAREVKLQSKKLGEYQFSFFTMDYLEGIGDFDEFIVDHSQTLTGADIIQYFRDALSGIAYLHERGIVHCDIKPANMFIAPEAPALVGDLGYSKKPLDASKDSSVTTAMFTEKYAHPRLRRYITERQREGAAAAPIPRSMLEPSFDLYAFGRSMQQVLTRLSAQKSVAARPGDQFAARDPFTRRQWLYLQYIAQRLLDGECENESSDVIPGLTEAVMREIRYESAEEALQDFEKLLGLYDLDGRIPELRPDIADYIQIPNAKVPFTKRVSDIVNHPALFRLASVTQLGFVSMVYPGAIHTRFEHALGTFTSCTSFVRSLWYDEVNPLFQCIVTADDLEAALLAALLHDIGQYPMAHDLHEVADTFSPDLFTYQLLRRPFPHADLPLDETIRAGWGGPDIVDRLLRIMRAGPHASFKERILNSLINGPYDCDKIDYLLRDSTHLGVTFGLAIDHDRLVRNLTLVYEPEPHLPEMPGFDRPAAPGMKIVGVGVTEKGLAAALVVCRAREDMFRQVYWQHSIRALKAMLGYVVRTTWQRMDDSAKRDLRERLHHTTFIEKFRPQTKAENIGKDELYPDFLDEGEIGLSDQARYLSGLSPSDDAVLDLFDGHANDGARRLIRYIRQRKLFRRLLVLSHSMTVPTSTDEARWYLKIYREFKRKRVSDPEGLKEDWAEWEDGFISAVEDALTKSPQLLPLGKTPHQIAEAMKADSPVLLVDVPIKSLAEESPAEMIWYLPEELVGIHARQLGPLPAVKSVTVDLSDTEFDLRVGKIRVLVAPEWSTLASRCINARALSEAHIWKIIAREALN